MYKYICETCLKVTDDDVWSCVNCGEESRVHQVTVTEDDSISFHSDVKEDVIDVLRTKVTGSLTIAHTDVSGIICPYCGYENSDETAVLEFEDEIDCADCDKRFGYSMKITYSTSKTN